MKHFLAALDGREKFLGDLRRERMVMQTPLAAEEAARQDAWSTSTTSDCV
jgi:hypothetical protein